MTVPRVRPMRNRTGSGIFVRNVQLQGGDFATFAYKQLKAFKPQDWIRSLAKRKK